MVFTQDSEVPTRNSSFSFLLIINNSHYLSTIISILKKNLKFDAGFIYSKNSPHSFSGQYLLVNKYLKTKN